VPLIWHEDIAYINLNMAFIKIIYIQSDTKLMKENGFSSCQQMAEAIRNVKTSSERYIGHGRLPDVGAS
jgi:hypothetical protein